MATFKQRLERLERISDRLSKAQQLEQIAAWGEQLKDSVVVKIDDLENLLNHRDSYSIRPMDDESRDRLQAAVDAAKARRAAEHG